LTTCSASQWFQSMQKSDSTLACMQSLSQLAMNK